MSTLNKRVLYDTAAANRSTGIINGKSSNILNWDDTSKKWAYPMYKNMLRNFWIPDEVSLIHDRNQYKELSEKERNAFNKIIGLLAFLDSVQTDFSSKVADYLTDSSLNALMTVLAFQEVVHNESYTYVLSSTTDSHTQQEIFEYWKTDNVLLERNQFIADGYTAFTENPTKETFIRAIVYDVILEGLFFYSGFAFFYNLARNQKMLGTAKMINFINRDEQLHVSLFANILKETLTENPELHTEEFANFVKETFQKAAELEIKWGNYIIGDEIEGIHSQELESYIRFMANKRTKELGFDPVFEGHQKNPMKWISVYNDNSKGKADFFETTVTDYNLVDQENDFDAL
ncbi:ribonucleoside-diphosphate reductase beta chain [Alteribacillus persepolensis]|uniref:Ribonucleoside-diphosphate reductase subunit beta n=1 Tax=Alteribacillus persepolensis TaxID=568899 RepID=A0A1G8B1B3_9BACI|nr:ribonucleotide-diphosphate reductase subunit beta [Alteribacillus persepolensis]SDH26420.1 ribonucleoside-diphosphate reductase beta chain [Alteribacillus persepolensis]